MNLLDSVGSVEARDQSQANWSGVLDGMKKLLEK